MKANELRIGNLILKEGEIITVSSFTLYNVERDEEAFEPIVLTEKWLLKLGFEWDIFYQGYTDGNWVIKPNDEKGYRLSYGKRKYDVIVWTIQYVHQLQNLYFALTGKELTI